jgi:hypothetical protein
MSHSESLRHQTSSPLKPMPWVAAAVVAKYLGVEVSYVYEHADELGARRLGNGPKARLRFRLDLVDRVLLSRSSGVRDHESPPQGVQRRRRHHGSSIRSVPLLPIRSAETRSC